MYKKILVPVDGSSTANLALKEGIQLAKTQNADLIMLHVLEPIMMAIADAYYYIDDKIKAALLEESEEILKNANELALQQGIKPKVLSQEAGGRRIAEVIADEARNQDVDIIVMGTHGRRGIDRLLIGSVAERLVRISPVSVLLVNNPSLEEGKTHSSQSASS